MSNVSKIARRAFLIGTAAVAGGFAVGYYYYRKPFPNPLDNELARDESTFNPYIKIDTSNNVTVIVPRSEMGQGVMTTLSALVAEELDVSLDQIKVEHGPAGKAYYSTAMFEDAVPFASFDDSLTAESVRSVTQVVSKLFGMQITGGSTSVLDHYDRMREAGGAARSMLITAAVSHFKVAVPFLSTKDGFVVNSKTGARASYGDLAEAAAKVPPPRSVVLKEAASWRYLGKSLPRVDGRSKSTGEAVFGIDIDLPRMVFATVRMNPCLGGAMKSFDASKALKMRGVQQVVDLGGGIGVIGDNTWRVFKAAEAVDIVWGEAPYPSTSDEIFEAIESAANVGPRQVMRDDGDVQTVIKNSDVRDVIQSDYRVPYLAHACMEPLNATARWADGELDVWSGNQSPTLVQMVGARVLGISADAVRVHTSLLGGGFGRRAEPDFVEYAIKLAQHTGGRPVKVTWTREEDTTHDVYRPAAIAKMSAVVKKDEGPKAFSSLTAVPSVLQSAAGRYIPGSKVPGLDRALVDGAFNQPYEIANYQVVGVPADVAVPVGFWRSVGNSHNGFFHECFMDEIAHKAGLDPLDMRIKLAARYPTAVNVLTAVGRMSSWIDAPGVGRGRGVAFTLSFRTWVAQVVEVSSSSNGIKIERIWCAVDVGLALDPGIIEAQMRSGIIFGLSAAIGQEITFEDGKVEQANFDDFDCLRIHQCPPIDVEILETSETMGGVGEPGLPPIAPALANAIFAATGKRIRQLPLSKEIDFSV